MRVYRYIHSILFEDKLNIGRFFLIGFIGLTLLTACSGGTVPQPGKESLGASAGDMPSSARSEKQVPKFEQPVSEPSQGVEALNEPATGPFTSPSDLPEAALVEAQGGGGELSAPVPVAPPAVAPAASPTATQSGSPGNLSVPAEPRIGYRAPDFSLQTLDGEFVQLSDLLGRPVLISYWATWCVPCQNELRILEQIYSEYGGEQFFVLTVNAIEQDSMEKVSNTVNQMGMSFPVLLDHGDGFAQKYQTLFFPTTFYLDADGIIRAIALGDTSEADFRAKIKKLLAGEL